MTDQTTESAERVSALVDGQLHGDEFLQALAELESNAQARSNWDTFHLLGDVMRSGASDVRVHDPEFVARLRQRMVKEVPDFAPIPGISTAVEDHFNPPRATSAINERNPYVNSQLPKGAFLEKIAAAEDYKKKAEDEKDN